MRLNLQNTPTDTDYIRQSAVAENRAAWSRFAPWLWNDVAEGRGPCRSSDICVRWQLPTSIAASAPATTTQMQIYCYSIIQFVAAYFARTLIPYNAARRGLYNCAIAGNIEMVPNRLRS